MNDWKQKYAKKIMSAEVALKQVKNGDRVVAGHACGEPPALVSPGCPGTESKKVEEVHMVAMGPAKYATPVANRCTVGRCQSLPPVAVQ